MLCTASLGRGRQRQFEQYGKVHKMKLLAPIAVLAISACGLLASKFSTTAFILATALVIAGVLLTAPQGQRGGYWLVCQCATLGSIPILSVQGNSPALQALLLATGLPLMLHARWSRATTAIAILYAALFVATLYFSSTDYGAFFIYALLASSALPAFVIASQTRAREHAVLIKALFTFVTAQLAISVYEVFVFQNPIWLVGFDGASIRDGLSSTLVPELMRSSGTFGHPLPQALVYVTGFSVACALGKRIDGRLRWAIYAICIAGCGLGSARSALVTIAGVAAYTAFRSSWPRAVNGIALVLAGTWIVNLNYDLGFDEQVDQFSASGSYTHRLGVLDAVPEILNRPWNEVVFGHGVRGQQIILQYISDQVSSIDNQYVNVIITSGLIGFAALISILCIAWTRSPDMRPILLGFLCMFWSFDVMSWQATLVIFAVTVGIAVKQELTNDPALTGSDRGTGLESVSPGHLATNTPLPTPGRRT